MDTAQSVIGELTKNDNPIVALLASIVLVLAGIVVFQWKYTTGKTVPKWIWDSMVQKLEAILDIQQKTNTILDERLKK